jgi:hypothetical protein
MLSLNIFWFAINTAVTAGIKYAYSNYIFLIPQNRRVICRDNNFADPVQPFLYRYPVIFAYQLTRSGKPHSHHRHSPFQNVCYP